MNDISVFLLGFDPQQGPIIELKEINTSFSDLELQSIKFNSFPESANPLPNGAHIYTYKISKYFCYTIYYSIPDPHSQRGFSQFSIVIATSCTFSKLFLSLLKSTTCLPTEKNELFQLIIHFIQIWQDITNSTKSDHYDLPLMNGTMSVTNGETSYDLLKSIYNNSPDYIPNMNFIGDDLTEALCVESLSSPDHTTDLTRLWEYSVLGEPILVLGATPEAASNAVLAIASLNFPEQSTQVIPYICISDPRFKEIHSGIVGTSNPIAPLIATSFKHVFRVGFNKNNGFVKEESLSKESSPFQYNYNNNFNYKTSKIDRDKILQRTNLNLRFAFYQNTKALKRAISSSIQSQISSDFIKLINKNYNILDICEFLQKQNVALEMTYINFAKLLISSPIFHRILKIELQSLEAKKKIIDFEFSVLQIKEIYNMKYLCTIVVRQIRNSDSSMQSALKKKLRVISSYVDWKSISCNVNAM